MAAKGDKQPNSPLEWIAGTLGLLIALAMLGVIGWEALSGSPQRPPEIVVQAERATRTAGGWVVDLVARNGSGSTAAAVHLSGELKQGDEAVESGQALIDYIPGRSERRASLIFTHDPAAYRLEVRATGFQEP
ncbi:MAG: TIGR02588 family protein [Pseudomonadota bacterium]|nr:TIGR02588 family protein [Pseudomonadota bacterium]